MPMAPVRSLGDIGVVSDLSNYDIPASGWSMAMNVRFEDKKIQRGPVVLTPGTVDSDPALLFNWVDNLAGTIQAAGVSRNGEVYKWTFNGTGVTQTDITPVAFVPNNSDLPVTTTEVNGIVYVNRPDHIPWKFQKDADSAFAEITNGATEWPTAYRVEALRSVRGVLVGINITNGATELPTSLIWSNFTTYDSMPPDWDVGSTTSSAGQNTLSDLEEPLLDGCPLRGDMILYASKETWIMRYVGGNDIFEFDRLFSPQGVINQNCVVELNGVHYVFGIDDLWVHDGVRPTSIADGKVRKTVFRALVNTQRHFCFTFHNAREREIWYCLPAQGSNLRWNVSDTTRGCTMAAIFNYSNNTWTFADLPFVTSAAEALSSISDTWDATSPETWDAASGGWDSGADAALTVKFIGMAANADASVSPGIAMFATPEDPGATGTVDTNLTSPILLSKINMDLDELQKPLRGYVLCSSIYPQIYTLYNEGITFQMGTADHPSASPTWGNTQDFTLSTYKMDHNIAGRYLSLRITSDIAESFEFTGMDLDLTVLGNR